MVRYSANIQYIQWLGVFDHLTLESFHMIVVKQANTETELYLVRSLSLSFVDWMMQNFPDVKDNINKYFKSLDAELASLPGKYAPPSGRLLIAYFENKAAGTVAVRKIDDKICEMKRLFVLTEFHGKGIGKVLATELINQSREIGYERMRLETSFRMIAAQGLYRSLGFQEIPPYYDAPDYLRGRAVFFELRLSA